MTMKPLIAETLEPGVVRLTFNRPEKLNALSTPMLRAFEARLDALADDSAVRVVILTGAGERAFVAGADIAEYRGRRTAAFVAITLVKTFGKVVNLMGCLRCAGEPPQNGFGRVPFAAVIFAFRFHVSFTAHRAYPLCSALLTIETIICPARVSREMFAFLIDG